MPVISFSDFKFELLMGLKRQTIRPSKYWLKFKKGDRLYAYWKLQNWREREFLFRAHISEIFIIRWRDFTDDLMKKDGFSSLEEANRKWFIPKYGVNGQIIPNKEFVVIRWDKPKEGMQLQIDDFLKIETPLTSVMEEIEEAYRSDLIGIHEYWLLTSNYKIVK